VVESHVEMRRVAVADVVDTHLEEQRATTRRRTVELA